MDVPPSYSGGAVGGVIDGGENLCTAIQSLTSTGTSCAKRKEMKNGHHGDEVM